MKVLTNAPAMPRSVVRMNPEGWLGPGARKRAITPARKPITIIQRMFHMARSRGCDAPRRYGTISGTRNANDLSTARDGTVLEIALQLPQLRLLKPISENIALGARLNV